MREIVIIDAIDNLSGRKRAAIGQQVHHIEVEGDVLIGKAFGFKSLVERVVWDPPAVNREEYILAGCVLMEGHKVAYPTLNSSPLIIVAAGTLDAVLFPTLKPIDIEFAHVAPDTLKTLDQLTICHEIHLLQFMASFYHRRCPNERTAPCQLRSGMGLNQFFADF